ncbi:cell wall metabolism sensor histidine kinase WalK [Kroppenstedtia pulmonis]|uniref:histidine kinase n=1 Tax=Kroppenstedtia pulmonis TaxID=1380685 RepID=A0A7D3XPW3_9BACL|nr:ATP-binding protein [Kroppenstedtia pulmonis]QKG85789.1 cell wall metabolism sensor histidine kinase WalK [Kroppenstedtia pulmonis]
MRWFRIFNSVQWKLVIIYISLLLIAVQLIGVYFFRSLEQYYEGNFRNQLETQADLLQGNVTELMVKRDQDSLTKREQIDDLVRQLFILNNKTDTVQIVDQDGVILSTTSDDSSLVGQKNVKVYRVLQGEVNSEEQIRPDAAGQRHMLMSYPIKEEGLVIGAIYIEAPMEEMYNTIRTINTILIKIALVALAGTGILVIILARTITNPVKDITQQATVMAEGDFNRKVDVKSQDEIGQLATAFNHLAQHLREALSQKEEEKGKLESVLANMSDGVIATDEKGRVIVINRRAEDILGWKPKQGEDIQQVLPLSQPVSLPLTEERETYMELDREDPDDQTVVKLTFTPIRRSDQTVGLIVVLQDVTEEEKLDRQRKEFVANVSHELRTPLTTIKSYLEALDEGGAMEDKELATRFLRVTRQESERMTRLIHDLLQLSRLDSEKARPHKQPLLLFDVLQEAADRFSVQCKQKNISLHLSLAHGLLPRVYAARDQLDQVLDNLLSNAVKYTPEGGSITLSAKRRVADGFISVSISDTGIGIPKKDLERIFERFYRVDKARSRNMGGTGLGLSIAKEIIQAHGGDIYMTSRYEKGTTVTFSLPPCEPEVVR